MRIGFSLSPGGLLLPWHMGVLSSLEEQGYLTSATPLAGSSAGAIAVAAHAAGVSPWDTVEATIRLNGALCGGAADDTGGGGVAARGRLLPLLRTELEDMLPENVHELYNEREGTVGIAYREVFPVPKNVLRTAYDSKDDCIEAVCNSSMFPFFSTDWPCVVRAPGNDLPYVPRLVVDGFFAVPRERFGCPVLPNVDRTVLVSVFPGAVSDETIEAADRIEPPPNADPAMFVRWATCTSSRKECRVMYEEGRAAAEKWASRNE
eukprot:CAMPEP_0194398970 /NCGR_PEP_ID=MMETSP0174-20130528/126402_1 /TAXON_ID=216777 /ORGANISM="Proboscia alata, Strain PI-D3" /LENGTH=262 /DNA_ID=CAMNT_0039195329 /DNA_START=20 /DNA_END=808 /DNA_ORIENTATION=+